MAICPESRLPFRPTDRPTIRPAVPTTRPYPPCNDDDDGDDNDDDERRQHGGVTSPPSPAKSLTVTHSLTHSQSVVNSFSLTHAESEKSEVRALFSILFAFISPKTRRYSLLSEAHSKSYLVLYIGHSHFIQSHSQSRSPTLTHFIHHISLYRSEIVVVVVRCSLFASLLRCFVASSAFRCDSIASLSS